MDNNIDNNVVEEKKMMTIVNEDGTEEDVEVVVAFEFKDNKKEYVVYTKNERDDSNNIIVYVSNVDRSNGEPNLIGVVFMLRLKNK